MTEPFDVSNLNFYFAVMLTRAYILSVIISYGCLPLYAEATFASVHVAGIFPDSVCTSYTTLCSRQIGILE